MSEQNEVCGDFGIAFNNIQKMIEFNTAWTKGYSGYWDGAVTGDQAVSLNAGEVAKTMDDHGRRAIFIGTPSGVAVLFDRYQQDDGKPYGLINYQIPQCEKLHWFFGHAGRCSSQQLRQFIDPNDPIDNVGAVLANK